MSTRRSRSQIRMYPLRFQTFFPLTFLDNLNFLLIFSINLFSRLARLWSLCQVFSRFKLRRNRQIEFLFSATTESRCWLLENYFTNNWCSSIVLWVLCCIRLFSFGCLRKRVCETRNRARSILRLYVLSRGFGKEKKQKIFFGVSLFGSSWNLSKINKNCSEIWRPFYDFFHSSLLKVSLSDHLLAFLDCSFNDVFNQIEFYLYVNAGFLKSALHNDVNICKGLNVHQIFINGIFWSFVRWPPL